MNFANLQKKIGYSFQDEELLKLALTHASYANEHHLECNERLEYLGDAVLQLCMSHYLYHTYDKNEGMLSKLRAQSVCEDALALYAQSLGLSEFILLGNGEIHAGGKKKPAILADAFEAMLAAIFLDSNFDTVYKTFEKVVVPKLKDTVMIKDYKSTFQEHVQADKRSLHYEIVRDEGPANDKTYEAVVYMDNILMGRGIGKTKKEAEQNAAKEALDKEARS